MGWRKEIGFMASRDIQCAYCGLKGEIREGYREPDDHPMTTFKYLGHNPFSGHLHYQCPGCSMILFVPPMDVLEGKSLTGVPATVENREPIATIRLKLLKKFKNFWNIQKGRR
jgi:hypothetical protein